MDLHGERGPWFAVLARTQREKLVTSLLERAGYECFLPVYRRRRRRSDRTRTCDAALFPGYLFCRLDPHDRLPVLSTPGVLQIVGVGKTPIPVADEEIIAIRRVLESGLSTMPWPYLNVGDAVRIEDGPLRGLTGIVVKFKSSTKLVVSVSLLQRSVAAEVQLSWIGDRRFHSAPVGSAASTFGSAAST